MKKWKKRIITILAAVAAAFVLIFIKQLITFGCASYIVRVGYRGMENLFHIPNEYYAVGLSGNSRVSGILAKAMLGEDIEERSIYDDTDTCYWFATLEYAPNGVSFTQNDWIETKFGKNYRLVYNGWTKNTTAPDENDLDIMRRAAESLHSGAPEEWSWQGGGTIGLTSFMLIRHDDRYLIIQDDDHIFAINENGTLKHLMERPKNGHIDYCFFR